MRVALLIGFRAWLARRLRRRQGKLCRSRSATPGRRFPARPMPPRAYGVPVGPAPAPMSAPASKASRASAPAIGSSARRAKSSAGSTSPSRATTESSSVSYNYASGDVAAADEQAEKLVRQYAQPLIVEAIDSTIEGRARDEQMKRQADAQSTTAMMGQLFNDVDKSMQGAVKSVRRAGTLPQAARRQRRGQQGAHQRHQADHRLERLLTIEEIPMRRTIFPVRRLRCPRSHRLRWGQGKYPMAVSDAWSKLSSAGYSGGQFRASRHAQGMDVSTTFQSFPTAPPIGSSRIRVRSSAGSTRRSRATPGEHDHL